MLPDELPNLRDALISDGFDPTKLRTCLEQYSKTLGQQTDTKYNHYDTPIEWLQIHEHQQSLALIITSIGD